MSPAVRGSSGTSCSRYLWVASRGNLPQTNTRIFVCVDSKIGKTWHTHTHTLQKTVSLFFILIPSSRLGLVNCDYQPRRVLFKLKKLGRSWLIQAVQLLSRLFARKHTVYRIYIHIYIRRIVLLLDEINYSLFFPFFVNGLITFQYRYQYDIYKFQNDKIDTSYMHVSSIFISFNSSVDYN